MPIIKSAQKRVRTARKATTRNVKTKRYLKSAVKTVKNAIKVGKKSTGVEFNEAISAIDKAVKKGVIHKNKAARLKSRLAASVKKSGAKLTGPSVKKTVKKAKAPTKKTPAKKSAAKPKKSPAKK
jgi:small subunit ribosomal protein S20